MKTIYKYKLKIKDEQHITLPVTAECLSVQFQGGTLNLWAIVNPEEVTTEVKILIVGTGNPFPEGGYEMFLGTVQQGPFVWHVFMVAG